ncbi:hypothetical protein K435DRAFT_779839 [Dendrothele bispora CBS 962.96]|uniref:Uncharacterized protein n=1 Tax=Dendrothele bispora (strain CBS 962.96) TaxID=1314807 RepID=A0A4S8LW97_DENBC|nr:hypothetical protein K435DRAFT_779839 [Dendrothele bispora CBS 962.96]
MVQAPRQVDLPPEIIEKIVFTVWRYTLSSYERILFMTTCPLLNRSWSTQYARISSRELYIPKVSYLLYLANIIRTGKSLIYARHDLRKRAETMTCFLDLRSYGSPSWTHWDKSTEEMYFIFSDVIMGDFSNGLGSCFPSLEELSLETVFYTAPHLWTSEMPQVAHTQVVLLVDKEKKNDKRKDKKQDPLLLSSPRRHTIQLNMAIRDPDAYLGVTNALWNYHSNPLSPYFTLLIRVILGGLSKSIHLRTSEKQSSEEGEHRPPSPMSKILRLSRRLQKSRKLKGDAHLFSCSAMFFETLGSDNDSSTATSAASGGAGHYSINQQLRMCGKDSSNPHLPQLYSIFSWDSVYNRLCHLTTRMFFTLGTIVSPTTLREGEWDLILPPMTMLEPEGLTRTAENGPSNPDGTANTSSSPLSEPPFSALYDLRSFMEAGAPTFSTKS